MSVYVLNLNLTPKLSYDSTQDILVFEWFCLESDALTVSSFMYVTVCLENNHTCNVHIQFSIFLCEIICWGGGGGGGGGGVWWVIQANFHEWRKILFWPTHPIIFHSFKFVDLICSKSVKRSSSDSYNLKSACFAVYKTCALQQPKVAVTCCHCVC